MTVPVIGSGRLVVGGKIVNISNDPVADDDSFSTAKDTPYNGTATATDVDGDPLTFSEETQPTNGVVSVSADGSYTYTPNAGYAGSDSFVFAVDDGRGGIDYGTISVTVTGEGDALSINSVTGAATSPTSGNITINVSKACTIHWRISSGGAVTDKVNDFHNAPVVTASGAHTYPNGGTLVPETQYWGNAWLEDGVNPDTAITSNTIFTTPATSNAAPTTITWQGGGTQINISEDKGTGATVGTVVADGTPAPTFAETADADNKFTVASNGVVTLSAEIDFTTDPQHLLTVQATNSEGNTSQELTVDVIESNAGGGDILATDYPGISSQAELLALFDGWTVTAGVHQVPGAADKVVELDASFGGFNISGYKFSHQVSIRGASPYSSPWNATTLIHDAGPYTGSDMTGDINIENCQNVRLYGMYIRGQLFADGSDSCTIERCWCSGVPFPLTTSGTSNVGTNWFSAVDNSTDLTFKNCYFSYWKTFGVSLDSGNTRATHSGHVFDAMRNDCLKNRTGSNTDTLIEDCWQCRTIVISDGVHTDFWQAQTTGTQTRQIIRRCVVWYGQRHNNSHYGVQGTWNAGSNVFVDGINEHNITASTAQNMIGFFSSGNSGCTSRYNTVIPYYQDDGVGGQRGNNPKIDTKGTNALDDFNILYTTANLSAGAGANGLAVTNLGSVQADTFDFDTLASHDHFSGYAQDSTGFEVFLPSAGATSVAHWDNANPIGAWQLLERVFDQGLHPGNVGWPVAEPWERQYNPNGTITTNYTGNYDGNGDNTA